MSKISQKIENYLSESDIRFFELYDGQERMVARLTITSLQKDRERIVDFLDKYPTVNSIQYKNKNYKVSDIRDINGIF